MSRGYSATPVWGLSRNSAVAAFFVKISRLRIEGLLNADKRQQISKTIISICFRCPKSRVFTRP